MNSKIKKIIIAVVVIGIIFIVYSIFFKGDPEIEALLKNEGQISTADVLGADIIKAINEISSLDLDRSIFNDPVLKSLVDHSTEIQPEPKGRKNPFAPIGSAGLTTNSSSTATN